MSALAGRGETPFPISLDHRVVEHAVSALLPERDCCGIASGGHLNAKDDPALPAPSPREIGIAGRSVRQGDRRALS